MLEPPRALAPGTVVEVDPQRLWFYTFQSTKGVVTKPDPVCFGHFLVKLDKPVQYGGQHRLRTISVQAKLLKPLSD